MTSLGLPSLPLPAGIDQAYVDCPAAGLTFHILYSGHTSDHSKPLVLLLHGYPELAFSWRKIIPAVAAKGYYVVAPDQRGYGRSRGGDTRPFSEVDLSQYFMTNLARDMVCLVHALGYKTVQAVVGHDFGATSAAMCALIRPDMFRSVFLMSHPFKGSPELPFATFSPEPSVLIRQENQDKSSTNDIHQALASLPEPRKHYKWYNSTSSAAADWDKPEQGMFDFLRGYYHLKSATWSGNHPHPLESWTATALAKMPPYYIMPLHAGMPVAVAEPMSTVSHDELEASKKWLSDEDLLVYVQEWIRTGFQPALNWYRTQTNRALQRDLDLFAGSKIVVPSIFVSGEKDWGNYQEPGVLERMNETCTNFKGTRLIEGAGHWPQQEQPQRVVDEILGFLAMV